MKNKTITCLALILTFSAMTACGGQNTASSPESSAEITTAAQTTAAEATAAETTVTTIEAATSETSEETTSEITAEGTASVSDVVSVWFEDALDARTLTINEDGTFTLEYKGGGARYGTVTIDYEEFGDGTKRPWYHLCEDDGNIWLSFAGDMDGEQLLDIWGIPEDEDEVHFRRDIAIRDEGDNSDEPNEYGYYPVSDPSETNISIDTIEGGWYCSEEDDYIVFTDVHTKELFTRDFVITYSEGTIDEGIVTLEYSLNPDDSKEYWYNLYLYDGTFFMGFSVSGELPLNDLYAGQSGEPHFVRDASYENPLEDNLSGSYGTPFDEYIGQWKSETQWNGSDLYIKISEDHGSIIAEVTSHSAVADYQWTYICEGSDDGTYIDCTGGGTLIRTDYDPNGDMQDPETVYSDGTARFNIKGGTLFWEDCKEDTARQVGFGKVE